ncbi:lipid A biosynthesis acyltransferase [Niabella terrae]
MPDWEGKSKGNKTGYGIFIRILKMVGVGPAYLLLVFVAAYYYLFSRKSSKAIWQLYRKRLGFSAGKSLVKLYQNYYRFGQAIIDRIAMMAGIKNRFSFDFDGEEHLHRMVAQGRGGLLLSAHIGNWEIAGHLLQRLNTPIHIVMFDGEQAQLKAYLEATTGPRNAHIIVIRDNLSHIYEITQALQRNELVCMHSDRFLPGNKTLETPLLGRNARFPQGPFVLASRLEVPVSFVFALKETLFHYHFFASESVVFKNSSSGNPQAILEAFAAAMEAKVRSYPTQWYNYYNFWN